MRITTLLIFLFSFLNSNGQPNAILLQPDSLLGEQVIDLSGKAMLWKAKLSDFSIPTHAPLFDSQKLHLFSPDSSWNLHFYAENQSKTDSLTSYLIFNNGQRADMTIYNAQGSRYLKTGRHLNYPDRVMPDYNYVIPMQLAPFEKSSVLVRYDNNMNNVLNFLDIQVLSKPSLDIYHQKRKERGQPHFIDECFCGNSILIKVQQRVLVLWTFCV
jgi:hypothetical protein